MVKDLLINNLIYSSYVDYNGNAITEIDYDKSAEEIVKDIIKDIKNKLTFLN